MIYTVRPAIPVEVREALEKPFPKMKVTELERARAYYAKKPPPTKAYDFKRYKEWPVCKALDDLFHEKCAYCESRYRAIDSRDVEHFRPKGGVREAPKHPGYWWLAASWSNLLPSCPPCNQRRRQLSFEPGMSLEEFERARLRQPDRTSGKADTFPVRGNKWIMDEKGNTALEDPLLIDPTDPRRKPQNHLEWVIDWDRTMYLWEATPVNAVVRPRLQAGTEDEYAKASIAVYGLNRAGLIRERMARIKEMQRMCRPAVDLFVDLTDNPNRADAAKLKARLASYKASLVEFTKAEEPYAAMARAFVAEFDAELKRLARTAG